ncbi:hypothetical protein D3C81_2069990 [compost metagenome]
MCLVYPGVGYFAFGAFVEGADRLPRLAPRTAGQAGGKRRLRGGLGVGGAGQLSGVVFAVSQSPRTAPDADAKQHRRRLHWLCQ